MKRLLKPHEVRMMKEYQETSEKLTKLRKFISETRDGINPVEISTEEYYLMRIQTEAMESYLTALGARAMLHGFDIVTGEAD